MNLTGIVTTGFFQYSFKFAVFHDLRVKVRKLILVTKIYI